MVAVLGFSKDDVTAAVQAMYADVAAVPSGYFHFPVGADAARALGYSENELDAVPRAVVESFAGVGYPFRDDVIREGDAVLDIGAGSGTDTILASRQVGETGKVWALDITPDMVAKLRKTVSEAGIANVEVFEADAEHIPLPDNSVDVVTSNGALNLVPDKRKAFAEIFRVLKPEGRVQIADIVISRPVPLGGRSDPELWAECVVGASIDEDYLDLFREAGFTDIREINSQDYFSLSPSEDTRRIAHSLGARNVEIAMRRPDESEVVVPGAVEQWARRLDPRRLARIGGRGLWGAVAAFAALIACYGTLAVVGLASLLGLGLVVDEGLWAVTIAALALLAVAATALNLRRHRQPWPLVAAAVGGAIIVYVMFVSYSMAVEALGFAVLVGAVILDLYNVYLAECVPKKARKQGRVATGAAERAAAGE